jgi:DNA-binding response OmpR family regulator
MLINVPGGGQVLVPLTPNAKRVQLLAYIAWRRGELIDRDKILEHVFGWGLPDEEATEEKLSERFESHKKLLRKKIREVAIEQINTPAGRQVIDPDVLDPFVSHSGFWDLPGRRSRGC